MSSNIESSKLTLESLTKCFNHLLEVSNKCVRVTNKIAGEYKCDNSNKLVIKQNTILDTLKTKMDNAKTAEEADSILLEAEKISDEAFKEYKKVVSDEEEYKRYRGSVYGVSETVDKTIDKLKGEITKLKASLEKETVIFDKLGEINLKVVEFKDDADKLCSIADEEEYKRYRGSVYGVSETVDKSIDKLKGEITKLKASLEEETVILGKLGELKLKVVESKNDADKLCSIIEEVHELKEDFSVEAVRLHNEILVSVPKFKESLLKEEVEEYEMVDANGDVPYDEEVAAEAKEIALDSKKNELEAKKIALESKKDELEAKKIELESKKDELEAKKIALEAKKIVLEAKNDESDLEDEAEIAAKKNVAKLEIEALISDASDNDSDEEELGDLPFTEDAKILVVEKSTGESKEILVSEIKKLTGNVDDKKLFEAAEKIANVDSHLSAAMKAIENAMKALGK